MSERARRRRKTDPPAKTPEQIAAENAFFNKPVCPCEEVEPEPLSEYDVPGEWVTYTGEVNQSILEYAALRAEDEADRLLRACEEETTPQMVHEYADRQREGYSASSSSDQSSALSDEAASSAPILDETEPSVPSLDEAVLSAPTQDEAAPSASTLDEAAAITPALDEDAAIAQALEKIAVTESAHQQSTAGVTVLDVYYSKARHNVETAVISRPHKDDAVIASVLDEAGPSASSLVEATATVGVALNATARQDTFYQPLDEWAVFMAAQSARDMADMSKQAKDAARQARRRAEAAELVGAHHVARLAAEAARFDSYAAQMAQISIDAQERATLVAQAFERANESASVENRIVFESPTTDEVSISDNS